MTGRWAKCCECGGEVVFDAWATLGGEISSQFGSCLCTGCDERDPDYTEEQGNEGTGSV